MSYELRQELEGAPEQGGGFHVSAVMLGGEMDD